MQAEQETRALIIQSEGDAEAAQLVNYSRRFTVGVGPMLIKCVICEQRRQVSDALAKHGRGLIEIRRIETAQAVAAALAGYVQSSADVL